jgi:uncharacterized membrane protein YraQ (UPF0718 family)
MLEIFTLMADGAVVRLGLDAASPLGKAVHFFIEDTTKIFVLMTVMMLAVGFARTWLSPQGVRAWLARQPQILAYFCAALLGALTPFCSCSSITLFVAFLSAGIPLGVTMAFLITSPIVNEVAAVLFGQMIGWHFTFIYVVTGMGVGILGGAIIDRLRLEHWVEPYMRAGGENITYARLADRWRVAEAETVDLLVRIGPYVVLGIALGAALHGFVPESWLTQHIGRDNPFAVPMAVVLGIPLYANVTSMVPIAQVLLAKGVPMGTTLAFMMSTVAVSLPELVILRRVLKPQLLVVFVAYLLVAFILLGYGFNALF